MKLKSREELDIHRWDEMIKKDPESSFFSYSWYLDSVAENWEVLVDENYENGMVLPYFYRLGIKTYYIPVFLQYVEVIGKVDWRGFLDDKSFNFYLKGEHEGKRRKTQKIFSERTISKQAVRMLKKAEKSGCLIEQTESYTDVLKIIKEELTDKLPELKTKMNTLQKLFQSAQKAGFLKVFEIKGKGGIVCLEDNKQVLYLKGAVVEDCKRNGGMYNVMNEAIEYALGKGKVFDFGGSNIEGVRRFNLNLGGEDVFYTHVIQEKYPVWYSWIKKLKDKLS